MAMGLPPPEALKAALAGLVVFGVAALTTAAAAKAERRAPHTLSITIDWTGAPARHPTDTHHASFSF